MSSFVLMSDEANEEIEKYLDSPASIIGGNGSLIFDPQDSRNTSFSLFMVTHNPLD